MTARAARQGLESARPGPAIWLWPVAAAVLAAWPVWRSLVPETPDQGEGWFRLQPLTGLALAALFIAWAWPRRKRMPELAFPFWVIVLAIHGLIRAMRGGDPAGADLCALMIAWTVATAIFASLALLQIEEAGIAAGCQTRPRVDLLPPVLWLGAAYAIAMLAITALNQLSPGSGLIMGVLSPGAILAWASLSDTARSVLSARRVHFANAAALLLLPRLRRWRLISPAILLSDRPKLAGLYPAEDVKPGDLAALAAALTMDDKSELGRAIQEFGVSHRIRLPILKDTPGQPAMQGRSATLPNGAEIALCDLAALSGDSFDLAPFADAAALAQSLNREVLAVIERRPQPRILGLIVFAIGTRTGASGALQSLRAQGKAVTLAAPPRDERDAPPLKSLQVAAASDDKDGPAGTLVVIRPEQTVAVDTAAMVLRFGTARPSGAEPAVSLVADREDARVLCDLARFAADFRARTVIVTLLSNAPGWALVAAAFGYVPQSPLLVTGTAVVGIVVAVATPQVLRLSPTLAKEVDEE